MKVIDILNEAKSTLFSFELLPPLKGHTIKTVFNAVDRLMEFSPAYINMTYHREEIVYLKGADSEQVPVKLRRRPGTVGLSVAIQQRYGIEVVPHMICGGFDAHETEDALIDLDFLGIQNILVVRGDADKISGRFEAKRGGHRYALDLVKQVNRLNRGVYLDKLIDKPKPTDFCIGVAGYPEKHPESPNIETDIEIVKKKVEAGASYIVTQMFFDNSSFFEYERKCRKAGITVPIIPGMKPLSIPEHLNILPKVFGVTIPQELAAMVRRCSSKQEVFEVGVEWAIAQSRELKAAGVPAIHYYTMGKAENIVRIARAVF